MTLVMKAVLVVLGLLTAILILAQLLMGQLMVDGTHLNLRKSHQHSGYTTVIFTLAYVALSLRILISVPTKTGKGG